MSEMNKAKPAYMVFADDGETALGTLYLTHDDAVADLEDMAIEHGGECAEDGMELEVNEMAHASVAIRFDADWIVEWNQEEVFFEDRLADAATDDLQRGLDALLARWGRGLDLWLARRLVSKWSRVDGVWVKTWGNQ